MQFNCPFCDAVLSAPAGADGTAMNCPQCKTRINVPVRIGEGKDASRHLPFPSRPSPRRNMVLVVAAVVLTCSVIIAGVALVSRTTTEGSQETHAPAVVVPASNDAKDKDYLATVEANFEEMMLLATEVFWGSDARDSAELGRLGSGTDARIKVLRLCRDQRDLAEAAKTMGAKEFIKKHGISDKDYRSTFAKSFPEKDNIYGEVNVLAKAACKRSLVEVDAHFAKEGARILDAISANKYIVNVDVIWRKRFDSAVVRYMERKAPVLVNRMMRLLWQMDSVRALHLKVYGKELPAKRPPYADAVENFAEVEADREAVELAEYFKKLK